jgi:hypothetical protein
MTKNDRCEVLKNEISGENQKPDILDRTSPNLDALDALVSLEKKLDASSKNAL